MYYLIRRRQYILFRTVIKISQREREKEISKQFKFSFSLFLCIKLLKIIKLLNNLSIISFPTPIYIYIFKKPYFYHDTDSKIYP